jgi:hypothetical protein
MRKLHAIIMFTIALAFASSSYAEMKYGVSAALTNIEASGTETENTEKNSKSVDSLVVIPSIFAEYAYSDTFAIGLDYIPFKADVSDSTHSRTDTETSVTGTAASTSTTRNQKAEAELKNHTTLYANYNVGAGYIKVGAVYVELDTGESLGTGSKYGNETIYGGVIGFGMEEGNIRAELLYTDYEDISLTSSVARTGVTTNNKIDAELDTLAFKLSYLF